MTWQANPFRIEFDELITPDGLHYPLDSGSNRFLVGGIGGQGLPRIDYRTQRGPKQHGESTIDYVLEPRVLTMIQRRNGHSRRDYWDIRADLLNHLRPNRGVLGTLELFTLRKILPDWSIWDIDVRIDQGPAWSQDASVWDEYSVQEALRFVAPDPTFYNPAADTVVFVGSEPVDQLVFPIQFPIQFGTLGALSSQASITYEGTWHAYPIITISGPINSPKVENTSIGEKVELSYNVALGETVTIDLTRGDKTVENNLGTNLIGTVTTDSDLATFRIAPDPEAPGGVNLIAGSGSGADTNTQMVIRWNTRRIGI